MQAGSRSRRPEPRGRLGVRGRRLDGAGVAFALLLGATGPALAQGVHVALAPTDTTVAPGSTFELHIQVTEPGSVFNAYDAVVGYDAAALTFLPTSPLSLQEGSYMKQACGSTYHRFISAGDSLTISHVLLCNGVALPGPGLLYKLRFRLIQFYNAGFFVNPSFPTDALVHIGVASDAAPPSAPELHLQAAPNPFNPVTRIDFDVPEPGSVELAVFDVLGQQIETLVRGRLEPGRHTAYWAGRTERGTRAASGAYYVTLRTEAATRTLRLVLVK